MLDGKVPVSFSTASTMFSTENIVFVNAYFKYIAMFSIKNIGLPLLMIRRLIWNPCVWQNQDLNRKVDDLSQVQNHIFGQRIWGQKCNMNVVFAHRKLGSTIRGYSVDTI
jgi:hypothetical protein